MLTCLPTTLFAGSYALELLRHGVVRCKHCGSPSRFVRFSHRDERGPRLLNGWLDGERRNPSAAVVADDGRRRVRELYARRLFEGLTRPYGARAQVLGIGRLRSRRLVGARAGLRG